MNNQNNSHNNKSKRQPNADSPLANNTKTKSDPKSKSVRPTTAREVALEVLTAVEEEGSYSNLVLNQMLNRIRLERADIGLATELVYGTISRLNTIDYFLGQFVAKGLNKLQPWVRNLLRFSFYQIYYLDRIPAHAAVNEAVNIAKRRGHQGISGMVNGVLRNVIRRREELVIPQDLPPAKRIALQHSFPEWMVARWIKQYDEATAEQICISNNEAPSVSIRVNTHRTSRTAMLELLQGEGYDVEISPLSPDGILVHGGGNMALTSWYQDGLISVQDESSMLVAEAVQAESGMNVLDCCAAPGGKSVHLAEKMNNSGHIIANDIHEHKRQLVDDQAERLQLSIIETTVGDALTLTERYPAESFDRILLDAPCSGLGVIRRKPDLKWNKSMADIKEIVQLQQQLLQNISTLLKPNGIMVYSTCTIERSENESIVESFLQQNKQFELVPFAPVNTNHAQIGIQILPQDFHSDGFYIAALRKISM
ncbi:16S rRNA (cytosine967-C5)-methyltransferase [Paenibacillus sp. SORGH_AS306]|uniref:16S rRNA (cytosine(967)-C(5))-methyltransferase RsmB n=1 Tax=unclassified Paenibacillus TaxID=185978 RepID=UPI0027815971|nr:MULTISPECIES: 16S rRNA (cytosine(967)-C(5))-methyltransferase RsmB [unclassified Paenibacillus]MDQ1234910.1 16S rRNA (cytosine967-C5)-methyltransferase [Paenibacillus sp. SORGH_AS_0306]MDR6111958.1 16S rRNA (cytosine967-C5)-methyltransferase [Paenibacillus sp. SORGH_AS_0338]